MTTPLILPHHESLIVLQLGTNAKKSLNLRKYPF